MQQLLSPTISYPSPLLHLTSHPFPPKPHFCPTHRLSFYPPPKMASFSGFLAKSQMGMTAAAAAGDGANGFSSLMDYVGKGGLDVGDDLLVLLYHIQFACKRIAAFVASPFNSALGKHSALTGATSGAAASDRDKPKPLDIVANEIILSSLRNSGKVSVMASEEDDAPTWINDDGPFVVVLDPLDGSRNIDASIPTGTIFGVYNRLTELDNQPTEEKALLNSLQSGRKLVAAGYISDICFTNSMVSYLDFLTDGQIYSVNDARYFDWPEGLRQYIDTVRQGKGKFPKKYSARYICSLVADFHRTVLYGGIAMNPRDHLRLVYEANPLSYLAEQAGGKGSDGKSRILSIQPVKLHQKLPLFLGSLEDIDELESYGDVQQKVNPGYEV
ncbi:hypothetical protein ES332_D12G018600v1 [Gossypium tomentosum]|uniref:fructose-bisphosphatase n=1 Tax=Gossypium tomentosum TaxID=34277 RepID=A0A5D2I3J9_GOSTO|nr:hypothetical protein ES332_D12G018600v1 [Gossypium tomentosum]